MALQGGMSVSNPNGNSNSSNAVLGNPLELLNAIIGTVQNSKELQKNAASLDSTDKAIQQRNAYQKGVDKALSEQGYKHGTEAIQSGMNPNDIATHDMMQSQQNVKQNPTSILSNMINPSTNTENPTNNDFGYKPDNPVSAFFNMLGFQPTAEAQVLLTQAASNRQKIAAGQPAEIAVPQAQAAEINQKIAGAVPLQPADIMKLNIDSYSAALKANQEAYANSNAEVANLAKTLEILQQGRSTFSKAFGGSNEAMNHLKSVIAAKTAENQKIGKNQKMLMENAPKVGGNNTQSSGFKVIGVR